ncbi:MFS transporter [Frigidibacter mobilis]|nr:MFS transporter [Frigidibacter mobilis]
MMATPRDKGNFRGLPRSIWALGFVSMLMDISSEMIHGLLPVFLVTVMGASTVTVGLIEGIGEATANITKLASGLISDRWGRRKPLAALGYGLSTLSKPLFALAPSAGIVLGARFADRVGKGIRGAPRDALVGELAPPGKRGAAFGLRQSLDSVGAFVGPLLAIALMAVFSDQFRTVFWLAAIPGVLAVLLLVLVVREPARAPVATPRPTPISLRNPGALGRHFWGVVALGGVMTLARFTEAFVILRAENLGLALALAPLILVVVSLVYAASAYPVGILSDRIGRTGLLASGFLVLIAADAVLALAGSLSAVFAGAALWGLHLGLTQGLLSALVAEHAPVDLKATAFGVFNLVTGIALLLASLLAGALWQLFGPAATFWTSGALAMAGLAGFLIVSRKRPAAPTPDP